MRTVVIVGQLGYSSELTHAIRNPLATKLREEIGRRIAQLPAGLSDEEREAEIVHLNRKKEGLKFLTSDSADDAVSRCRAQQYYWMPPYFIVTSSASSGMRIARMMYHGLIAENVSDIVVMSNVMGALPSATRQEDGILCTVGTMKRRVVRDAVIAALMDFALDERVQRRITMSSISCIRPSSAPPPKYSVTA